MPDQNTNSGFGSAYTSPATPSSGGYLPASSSGFGSAYTSSAPTTIPNSGKPSTPSSGSDDESWLHKAWDFANTPLTETLGIPSERQGAGGFERAGEHILSGLTSPLSLALTAATFGTGGFIESAGASALREAGEAAGLSGEEIAANLANAEKSAKIAVDTSRSLPTAPIKEALEADGHDLDLVNRARTDLGDVDMSGRFGTEEAQKILAKKGYSEAERDALSKASDTINKAHRDFTPVEDAIRNAGLDVDKWTEARELLRANNLNEQDLLGGNALERGTFQILRKTLPTTPIATSVKMARTAQTLMNAGFTLQQFETAAAMSPRFIDALKEGDTDAAEEYGTEALAGGALGAAGLGHFLHSAGELFDPLTEPTSKLRPSDEVLKYNQVHGELLGNRQVAEDQAGALRKQAYDILERKPEGKIIKDSPEVKAQKSLEDFNVYHQAVTGGDPNKAAAWYNAYAEAAGKDDKIPVNGNSSQYLPENISDLIKNNNLEKTSPEYQDLVLKSLKNVAEGNLSDKEIEAAKFLRQGEDRNHEIASANGSLNAYVENYMKRRYKDENEEGKVITAQAKSGNFATNISGAAQRVYDSHLTALLKSPKEIDFRPIDLTADNRAEVLKAAANKKWLADIQDRDLRDSTGRPILVQSGAGNVVSGENGEDPTTFIRPDAVNLRKLNIADPSVQRMQKNGMLDHYLETGDIRDITPKVNPSNIGAAVSRLEEKMVSKPITFDEEGNSVNLKNIQLLKDVQSGKRPWSDLKEYNDALKPVYVWSPQDYVSLDTTGMKGWNHVTNDSAGNKILVNSDLKASPEFAQDIKNRLGLEKSYLQQHPIPAQLLKANTKLKSVLLNLSPFHLAQEVLRAVMVGVNPFTTARPDLLTGERVDPADPNSPTILKKVVEKGMTTGTDGKALEGSSEGVASGGLNLLRKAGPIGKTVANSMDWYHDFLFKRVIPSFKARASEKLFRDYQAKHPDWTTDRVAKVTADHVNSTFGGINWQAMGRSATTQDWGRIMFLAPDWLEAEMRSMGRLFNGEEGGVNRRQVVQMALGLWGLARVANLANTGNAHYEAPFGLATQDKDGKDVIYSMRTLPTDMLHAASDPVNFLRGRISPTLNIGYEAGSGRDRYGRKLGPQDMWADVARNMLPIPVQDVGQAISGFGPQVGNIGQVANAVGATATVYHTPAQKMAADLASTHSEDGVVDPALQARHRKVMEFEDAARRGEMSMPDLMRLTYQTDQLKETELKKIQNNLKHTEGMSSDMASLYTRASRLPAKEYLDLLDQANASEKAALARLTLQVQKKYLTKAKRDLTPHERENDPVFQRLLKMVPPMNNSSL